MIVDRKGNLFEDRRKNNKNSIQNGCDTKSEKRGVERRKAPDQITKRGRTIK